MHSQLKLLPRLVAERVRQIVGEGEPVARRAHGHFRDVSGRVVKNRQLFGEPHAAQSFEHALGQLVDGSVAPRSYGRLDRIRPGAVHLSPVYAQHAVDDVAPRVGKVHVDEPHLPLFRLEF